MDLGFIQAGFNVIWANDIDPVACQTYARNIGPHIACGSICDISADSVPDSDVMIGGFPCQDFSMIWKRGGIETDRGNLYRDFVRLVTEKKPKVFVAENVKGLLTANKGMAAKQIVEDFTLAGYKVQLKLINFASYGVSQLRERVLIVGVRNDIDKSFEFPSPTHSEDSFLSSRQALEGVSKVRHNNEHQNIQPKTIEMLKLIPPGGNFTSIPKDSPYYVKGMISHVYRRLHPDKPSTTIIASGGGGTWGYHFNEPRPLTNRERARLFGYPDDFVFDGTITEVRRQIGNSVPPAGIRVIAENIARFLRSTK